MATNNSINSSTNQVLPLAGGTMTGAINMGSHQINSVTDPTSAQDAATKNYVDSVAAGLNPKTAVNAATTAALVGVYLNGTAGVGASFTTTATGVLTIDGQTVLIGNRYLLKNQTSGFQNGAYDCTTAGALGVATVFTRSSDYNNATEMDTGGLIPVISGTANANTAWLQSATITTVGTDNLVFTQFGSASPLTTKGDLWGYDTANNRIPVGADGTIFFGNSSLSLGVGYDYFRWTTQARKTYTYQHEYDTNSATIDNSSSNANSGTGSSVAIQQGVDGTTHGLIQLTTGTTTTGNAVHYTGSSGSPSLYVGGGQIIYEVCLSPDALSNGTDTYTIIAGIVSSTTAVATPTTGIFFKYNSGVNSGNWAGGTTKASSATAVNSSVPPIANAGTVGANFSLLKFIVNDAASSVTFYVNNTSIGSSATNIPLGSTALFPIFYILKSAGTTSVSLFVDYLSLSRDFTVAR